MNSPTREPADDKEQTLSVKVWDVYLRLFHWLLVIGVATSLISVQLDAMQVHITAGIFITALLTFRLIWGVIGSSTAQFHRFVRGPRAVVASVFPQRFAHKTDASTGISRQHAGHSPLGALSVIAMLAILTAQVGTGLFADDEIFSSGPLARYVSIDFSALATSLHGMNAKILFALICVHIGAIVFYKFIKKNNLTLAMLTGRKATTVSQAKSLEAVTIRGLVPAAIAIIIAAATGLYLINI